MAADPSVVTAAVVTNSSYRFTTEVKAYLNNSLDVA
jgi:hypothetical protein